MEKTFHSSTLDADFVLIPYRKPFYMQTTLTTQRQWKKIMRNNLSTLKGDNLPVETVSWYDCQRFIKKLNQIENKIYQLPKCKGWRFACGEDPENLDDYAWYNVNAEGITHPVGTKLPNKYGLYDMLGNVWEWCGNKKNKDDYVLRGGSWYSTPQIVRAAYRVRYDPASRNILVGFRLSLSAPSITKDKGVI